jgi:integrase
MAKDLTQFALDALRPCPTRREVPDGKQRGLYFIMQPSGAMSWAFRYRFAGATKKLTLGPYPAIDLPTARAKAAKAASALADSLDPASEKKAAKLAEKVKAEAEVAPLDLVETVASAFIERYAKRLTREKTWRETERLLVREVVAPWRGRRLSALTRADVHDLLDRIADRPAPIVANRTLAAFRRMCSWAEERGLIGSSPCEKIRAPAAERSRDRILSDDEIRVAWRAFDVVGWPFGPFSKLLLLVGARRDEVASAGWSEFDLAAKIWTIPKERAKNGQAHEVPLSESALRVLEALPHIEARHRSAGLIFSTTGKTAVSGFSRAKTAIDEAILAAKRESAAQRGDDQASVQAPEPWTFHDLRRTTASGMASLGIAPHVVEAVLNHRSGTIKGVSAVYNRYSYSAEKRAAIDAWGRHLDALVAGKPASNIVDLAARR